MACGRYFLCGYSLYLFLVFLEICGVVESNNVDQYLYVSDALPDHNGLAYVTNLELLNDETYYTRQRRDVESPIMASSTQMPEHKSEKYIPGRRKILDTTFGANGAGQRKNISLNTPEIELNDESPQDSPISGEILPNKLTPEEVGVGDEIDKKDLENNNITSVKSDTHIFYNSSTFADPKIAKSLWVDLSKQVDVKINDLLSNSHRRAATVKLSFEFPFYGHYIKNVTVATGGFLYTGNYVHSWLAATQYIAPLMANFDTGISNSSFVKYVDNGTAFTVEWDKVALQDKPTYEFTFQTTLHKNGDIVFVYKSLPMSIKDINDQHHPVKVGLSDAYIMDRTVFYVRRKTIYEYHRVAFDKESLKNWTAIYLKALPTCLDSLDCHSCLTKNLNLNCTWCPALKQCSNGQDRNRQAWLDNNCNITSLYSEEYPKCILLIEQTTSEPAIIDMDGSVVKLRNEDYIVRIPGASLGTTGWVAIMSLVILVIGFGFWAVYAYKNPHTTSGQILIRYRPSQWKWRRGEARYTAATIHM